jgi:hypothetical protein
LKELARALVVLALIFLNFGHAAIGIDTVAASEPQSFFTLQSTDFSLCGDDQHGAPADHVTCHVCRLGAGLDVPPPPATLAPAFLAFAPTSYSGVTTVFRPRPLPTPGNPRAPPLI